MPMGNPGEVAAGVSKVREAINILQVALPQFPVGSDIQKTVLKCIEQLSKLAVPAEASPQLQGSTLMQLLQQQQQGAPMQAAIRALGAGGGGPPPGMDPAAAMGAAA